MHAGPAVAGRAVWRPAGDVSQAAEREWVSGLGLPAFVEDGAGPCLLPTGDRRNLGLTGFFQSVLHPPPLGEPPNHRQERPRGQGSLIF